MLSLKEINEVSFGKAGFSGYKPDDVDNFIDEVLDTFKQQLAEKEEADKQISELMGRNTELQEKLAILAKKVESYQDDEDGIKDAIVAAQKISKQTIADSQKKITAMMDDARKKADAIISEAKAKAAQSLSDAKREADKLLFDAKAEAGELAKIYAEKTEGKKHELDEMKKQVTAFRSSLLEMYKKHLEQVTHIPTFKVKDTDVQAALQESAAVQEALLKTEKREAPQNSQQKRDAAVSDTPKVQPGKTQAETDNHIAAPVPAPIPKPQNNQPRPKHRPKPGKNTQPFKQGNPAKNHAAPNPMTQRVDFTQEQNERYPANDDLADMGINTKAFTIPDSLRKEKETRFSNLEFGESVDVTRK